jgi:hypothetical protein
MRAVRIIVVLLVIVVVAFGLYYLDQRGTFRMTHNGEEAEIIQPLANSSADNANSNGSATPAATNPEHEAAMQAPAAAANGPSGTADASATSPTTSLTSGTMGRAPNGTMVNANQTSSSQMSAAPAQVMTIRGMQYSCTVIGPAPRVERAPRAQVTETTPRVHHYRRREPMRMQSAYAPMPYASFHPVCSNWQKGPDGFHQVNLPAGMLINIGLDHTLAAGVDMPGETFGGYLIGPVTYCGMVVIPAGARVQAVVTQSRTRGLFSEADSVLAMQLTSIDANGWRFPVMGTGMSRIMPDDASLQVVAYKDPNDGAFREVQRRGRNVVLPEQSVVSFWLQAPSPVYF